jgi:hypothetical protein
MHMKSSKSIRVPSCTGKKGLPPKVASFGQPPKKGIVSPCTSGGRGKPHSKGFPNTPPARD